jgi:excisionase family DNA binding protein
MEAATQVVDEQRAPLDGGALLLPVRDAAAALGVSIRTVWRLIDAKHLHTTKIGGRTLVTMASVRHVAAHGAQ